MILGIDPGKDGAGVLLADDGTVPFTWLTDASCVERAVRTGRKEYVPQLMLGMLQRAQLLGVRLVVLELPGVRPGEGRGGGLTTGVGWGLWRMAVAAVGLPIVTPAASAWTRVVLRDAPGEGKDRAVHVALARVPALNLTPGRRTKAHSGLADAACLALYGRTR
jgi:hypothetical protein